MDGSTIGFLAGIVIIGLSTIVISMAAIGFQWKGYPANWEELVTGVMAVFAAVFTIRQVTRQISQTGEIEDERRRRDELAARSVLPLALTAISDYRQACNRELLSAIGDSPTNLRSRSFLFANVPTEVIPIIQDCVRYTDRLRQAELADLISEIQIFSARLRGFESGSGLRIPLTS